MIGGVSECLGISQPVDQVADGCGLHGARHGDATGFDSPGCRAASSGPTVLSLVVFVDLNGIYFFFSSTRFYFVLLHKQGEIRHRKQVRFLVFETTLKPQAEVCTRGT